MKQDRQPGTDAYKTVVTVGNCCGEGGGRGGGEMGRGGGDAGPICKASKNANLPNTST